jgi:hypothetical protein
VEKAAGKSLKKSLPDFGGMGWEIIRQKTIAIWWLILYNPTKVNFVPENLGAVRDENG